MSLEQIKDLIPDYAKDLRLNISSLASDPTLTPQQIAGTFIASAIASRNTKVTQAITAEFANKLSPEALEAARSAAAIMGMNNIYYRFVHLVGGEYGKMPAKLRMNVIANPGIAEKVDFELWCLAVSAVNGCGMCMESHEKTVRKEGITQEQVQTAIRIASVVHAVAVTIEDSNARA